MNFDINSISNMNFEMYSVCTKNFNFNSEDIINYIIYIILNSINRQYKLGYLLSGQFTEWAL